MNDMRYMNTIYLDHLSFFFMTKLIDYVLIFIIQFRSNKSLLGF